MKGNEILPQTKLDRTGEVRYNNQGLKMEIIKYRTCDDIDVKFDNGYIAEHRQYNKFKSAKIKNLYLPLVYDVGYIGEGEFSAFINNKMIKSYATWRDMLKRCYDKIFLERNQTYIGCLVDEKWHNYQNFAKWYYDNYYEIDGEKTCLDKDILIKHNKIYSSDNCIFVPHRINTLFVKSNKRRGNYPIGVHYSKSHHKFVAQVNKICNTSGYLGDFNTAEEAFLAYKIAKETYIKEVADQYKDKIPQKLYDAMYRYEVEIDD